jgi:Rps23 Pro-64 3,4-dihydroxylase Tpa1-like proline 4-hydroxylase
MLNFKYLDTLANDSAGSYQSAQPFPHIMFEKLLDTSYLNAVLDAFPSAEQNLNWRKVTAKLDGSNVQYNKLGMPHEREVAPIIRALLWEFNSSRFLRFLGSLTGIKGLMPDPMLQGGGLHQSLPGGVLGVHADFTRHRVYDLDRRINVLLYLNKDWLAEYGGHLELWSRDVSRCERRIMPSFGRCVIFNTDADSFHGHPQEIQCPDGDTRKSIALYYYTNGRSDASVAPTNATDWQKLPEVELPTLE